MNKDFLNYYISQYKAFHWSTKLNTFRYQDEIEKWDWDHIKKEVFELSEHFVGSFVDVLPCGRLHLPWFSQSEKEKLEDCYFLEALETVTKRNNLRVYFRDSAIIEIFLKSC